MTFAEQFESIKNQKTLMVGLLFLLVIVVFWIGLSMFGSQTKFAVSKEMRDLAKPLTPTLKESSLARIEQKRQIRPSELEGFTIYKIIEERGVTGGGVRVVDINYVEPEDGVAYGTLPKPRQGGLSNYLQANPDFDATKSADVDIESEAVQPDQAQQPAGDQPIPQEEPLTTPNEGEARTTVTEQQQPTPTIQDDQDDQATPSAVQ